MRLGRRISGARIGVLLAVALGGGASAVAQVPAVMYHAHANLGYVRENFKGDLDYLADTSFSTITASAGGRSVATHTAPMG
jgi:hypothetical protein